MSNERINNVNVIAQELLPTPEEVKSRLPVTARAESTVLRTRKIVQNILDRRDERVFAVVGPCSIHDVDAAREYAGRLQRLADVVNDALVLIMRVYFEKPRTSMGWKGLINDPFLDDSFHIERGIVTARELLLEMAERGLPVGTEALDPITPQYLGDLITWTAIGARTAESQTHREMSSGLSTPVGFKNGTDGSLDTAVNAMSSASNPHSFLGIDQSGRCAVVRTSGNRYGHMVLRGGIEGPNYDSVSVSLCEQALHMAGLPANIVVDCSHANSHKDFNLQPLVLENCVNQIVEGNRSIVGVMLESNLHAGNQKLTANPADLRYGVSVTDGCIDWTATERIILEAREKLGPVLRARRKGSTQDFAGV